MSNFTPVVNVEIPFEGDVVKVGIRRLKKKQAMKFGLMLRSEARLLSDDSLTISFDTTSGNFEEQAAIIREQIARFEGLTDADGEPLGVDVLFEEQYFAPVLQQIIVNIIQHSNLLQEEKDALGKPPEKP